MEDLPTTALVEIRPDTSSLVRKACACVWLVTSALSFSKGRICFAANAPCKHVKKPI